MSSGKHSLLVDKSKMPLTLGLAFVAFTTQFGGGFASGAQIYQYFINYGIWCLVLPFLSQGLYALFFWYGMRYAYKHKTYDYRSFSDSLYGKTRHLMSNLYEICYLIMIGTASAAAFATGGSTISTLFGIPYWMSTVIIGAFIFFIALFGTSVVRKCASTLSVLIIAGLVLVLVPNIIAQWSDITVSVSRMAGGEMSVLSSESGAFGSALWSAVLYFFFQLASVSVMYQQMEEVTDVKQINRAAVWMFVCNFVAMELSINPNTIQRAYAELERHGYIYTIKGRGSFVSENSTMKENKKKELLVRVSEMIDEAISLGIPDEEIKRMVEIQYQAAKKEGGGKA